MERAGSVARRDVTLRLQPSVAKTTTCKFFSVTKSLLKTGNITSQYHMQFSVVIIAHCNASENVTQLYLTRL